MLIFPLACLGADRSDDTDLTGPPDGTACADQAFEGTLALDPDGPDTQIHIASAFDGEQIWMAWNRPAPSGALQVFVGAIACDGSVSVEPGRVDEGTDNQIQPRREGAAFTGSLWMASLGASESGWWLAGSAAVGNGVRVFLTELDPAGSPVNVTPITDDLAFVAWQEGTSPAFRTFGRFVRPE